jgi:hypothetical protein
VSPELSRSGTLDHGKNNTEGAYVPLDDGDADGNGTPASTVSGSGNEYQLLPITLNAEPTSNGQYGLDYYSLDIPSNVHVWADSSKTSRVDGSTSFWAGTSTTLYVEGMSEGSGTLGLNFCHQGNMNHYNDTLTVNVFTMEGPQAVPNHSRYTYTADGGASGQSGWLPPTGPSSWEQPQGAESLSVLWGQGPADGSVAYMASADYSWGRYVSIIQVTIAPFQGGDSFTASSVISNYHQIQGVWGEDITVGQDVEAGQYVQLSGPNGQWGLHEINVGFVQTIEIAACSASYVNGTTMVSSLQGQDLLDISQASVWPYYSITSSSVIVASPSQPTTRNLYIGDEPSLFVPFLGPGGSFLDTDCILYHFYDYIAASTTRAPSTFTAYAGMEWAFDGSGFEDANNTWNPGTAAAYEVSAWAPITDGSTVPGLQLTTTQTALNNMFWVPQ